MRAVPVRDRAALRAALEADAWLNLYALGDLDDGLFPHTRWWALDGDPSAALLLLYTAVEPPVLLGLSAGPTGPLASLLAAAAPALPDALYAHLSPGLAEALGGFRAEPAEPHLKMALVGDAFRGAPIPPGYATRRLSGADLPELLRLYEVAYPGTWFTPASLELGPYVGLFDERGVVAVAGVHLYSEAMDAAALGNITTHPSLRGHGLGAAVSAELCRILRARVGRVGLNVSASNPAAVRCYEKLGFRVHAPYDEVALAR